MSATMHLYKPIKGVIPTAGPFWFMSSGEQWKTDQHLLHCSEMDSDAYFNEMYETTYSDGKEHEIINLTPLRTKYRMVKRLRNKRVQRYPFQKRSLFKDYIVHGYKENKGTTRDILVVDEICYGQGWMFNKKFFTKSETWFEAYTKEDMIKLLDRYMQSKHIVPVFDKEEGYDHVCWDPYNPGQVMYTKNEPYDITKIKERFIEAWNNSGCTNLIFTLCF